MIKDGGQAYPNNIAVNDNGIRFYGNPGMSIRDYFAAKALPLVTSRIAKNEYWNYAWIAEETYRMADAMIKEKDKQQQPIPTTL